MARECHPERPSNTHTATVHALTRHGFRLFPVRSPLLGESRLIPFPPGTEMVQFPGFPFHALCIQTWMVRSLTHRVTPFGHPGISGCVLLPPAFRSLPRPSSYSSSKASTMDPFSLDHIFPSRRDHSPRSSCPALRPAVPTGSRPVFPVPMDRQLRLIPLHRVPAALSRHRSTVFSPFPRVVKDQVARGCPLGRHRPTR